MLSGVSRWCSSGQIQQVQCDFQSKKPLLHDLKDYVHKLILDLIRSYMKGSYVYS